MDRPDTRRLDSRRAPLSLGHLELLLLSSIWIAFSSPATAAGQPSEAEVAQAQAQYEEGLALMEQALYAEALERFQTSYTMMEGHPNQPLILFQVARAHQEIVTGLGLRRPRGSEVLR